MRHVTMPPAPAPNQSNHSAIGTGYTPFSIQRNLDKLSANSMLSGGSQGASLPSTHGLCSCGSLSTWSSLQLQEQHLLGGGNSNACSINNCSTACTGQVSSTAQDMLVLVLPRGEQDMAAGNGAGTDKQKPRPSQGGSNQRVSSAGSMKSVRQLCSQSPKQLTQEFCLRLVALLLVVLATVGLAYRLAKKDD